MKRFILIIIMVCLLGGSSVFAQEKGSLMMEVELGATLGGTLVGAGIGVVVWLTDPGGPTSPLVVIKDGAALGTMLGAIAGYYLLYSAAITPGSPAESENLDELLGGFDPPEKQAQKQGFSMTVVNFNF